MLIPVRRGFEEKFLNDQKVCANIDPNFILQQFASILYYTLSGLDTSEMVSMLLRNPQSLHRNLVLHARLLCIFLGILDCVDNFTLVYIEEWSLGI